MQDSGQLNTRLAVWDNRAASKCTLQMNRIAGSGAGRGGWGAANVIKREMHSADATSDLHAPDARTDKDSF